MNKHQLDRLFEEKLGAAQQQPSDKAKARFDQLLAQKHKKPVLIWWQVAAAVLLLAVSTVTYLSWPTGDDQPLTADLPEISTDPIATTTDSVVAAPESPETTSDSEEEVIPDKETIDIPQTQPALAVNVETSEEETELEEEIATLPTGNDIADTSTIAVAENDEKENERVPVEEAETTVTADELDVALSSEVAIAANESPVEAPKKKRLPVTIIYKSASADQSLIAMQDIRSDVDSLADERSNSLKSILQNAGSGSLLAELKKAKEDLFSLDIPLKSKKVEN